MRQWCNFNTQIYAFPVQETVHELRTQPEAIGGGDAVPGVHPALHVTGRSGHHQGIRRSGNAHVRQNIENKLL